MCQRRQSPKSWAAGDQQAKRIFAKSSNFAEDVETRSPLIFEIQELGKLVKDAGRPKKGS